MGFFFISFSERGNILLVFQELYEYHDPINVIFLCGSSYDFGDETDKRNVLKAYIEKNMPACQPVILEENFWFKKTNRQYFSYDNIFLKNLAQIEQLAALFALKIIIVHESISTAAEIGAFAIDPVLAKKICLLIPDSFAIEEKKLSAFIRLAFFAKGSQESNIHRKITYYPDVEIIRRSPNKSEYYTFFHNNEVGEYLGYKINSFLKKSNAKSSFLIKKAPFGRLVNGKKVISYVINHEAKETEVSVPPQIFKAQILSLFFQAEFRRSVRQAKMIREHVSFIEQYYLDIVRSTIEMLSGEQVGGYKVKCKLQQTTCTVRQAIGYLIYMLQASKFITLEQTNENVEIRKMTLSMSLEKCRDDFAGILYNTNQTTFGRLNI